MAPFPLTDLTSEIVDLTMDTSAAMRETGDTWTMLLGVVVTLLPKIMPKMLPVLVGTPEIQERFGAEDYNEKIEHMFRGKMLDNLAMIEGFIRAWKDDTLDLTDYGFDSNLIKAKSDLIVGEPESFQDELLNGISFIQKRIARSDDGEDHIAKIANRIWDTANAITMVISQYLF